MITGAKISFIKTKVIFAKIRLLKIRLLTAVLLSLFSIALPLKFVLAGAASTIASIIPGGETLMAIKNFFTLPGLIDIYFRIAFFLTNMILGGLVIISQWIFNWALLLGTGNELMKIVNVGWGISLAFANNFFILILLAIAISTILGFDTFNYKKILPSFLMVLLLINFSLVIGKVIIDATNIFAISFAGDILKKSAGVSGEIKASEFIGAALHIQDPIAQTNKDVLEQMGNVLENFTNLLIKNLFQSFTYLLSIFIFLAGAVYMIQRAFWMAFLLMIAPLAWITMLIPSLKKHWSKWWNKFIMWALFAPAYLFFVMLGIKISTITFSLPGSLDVLDAGKIIGILIVAFIMLTGLKISEALGVGGSNFVINWGNKQLGDFKDTMHKLRSQTKISKFVDTIGEKAGGLTAKGISNIPGVSWATGYTKGGVIQKLELQRLAEKQKKIKEESEKYMIERYDSTPTQKGIEEKALTILKRGGNISTEDAALLAAFHKRAKDEGGSGNGLKQEVVREIKAASQAAAQEIKHTPIFANPTTIAADLYKP